ncbi:MAG: hypothetical protein NTV97_09160 [Alphaproteobacteria bacterium]|nr:hypothetical protein [Alphaproteobacteria bacterium]
MRVLIGDKPQGELTAKQEANVSSVRKEERVEGTVLSPDEATQGYLGQTRLLYLIMAGSTVVLTLGLCLLADQQDQAMIFAAAIGCDLALALFLVFLLRRRARIWRDKLPQRAAGLPTIGTTIVVDAPGLVIAGRTFPWPALRIDQVDLAGFSSERRTIYFIERLALAAGGDTIVLDAMMIGKGRLIVGNVWRRMRPVAP